MDENPPPTASHVSAARRVTIAGACGAVAFALTWVLVPWQVALLAGWDAAAALYVAWIWVSLRHKDAEVTRELATTEDSSRTASDFMLISASVANLIGVGFALLEASSKSGAVQAVITAIAILGVALSWIAVNTVFALRYAHLYYGDVPGGITFNDDDPPTYAEFAYLAFTIGMTYQVSDTAVTARPIRRAVLRHALLSYLFGVFVLAVTINFVAGLLTP
jgi:uncharacterized membrane protein